MNVTHKFCKYICIPQPQLGTKLVNVYRYTVCAVIQPHTLTPNFLCYRLSSMQQDDVVKYLLPGRIEKFQEQDMSVDCLKLHSTIPPSELREISAISTSEVYVTFLFVLEWMQSGLNLHDIHTMLLSILSIFSAVQSGAKYLHWLQQYQNPPSILYSVFNFVPLFWHYALGKVNFFSVNNTECIYGHMILFDHEFTKVSIHNW